MARVLIHHGLANRRLPNHWQRHLANELRQQGHSVSYPQFPNPEQPALDAWQHLLKAEAEMLVDAGESLGELVFVGHSLGCLNFMWAAVHEELPTKFNRTLLVAPADPALLPDLEIGGLLLTDPGFADRIKRFAGHLTVVASDNDKWIPRGIGPTFGVPLAVDPVVIEGGQHISLADGWGRWQGVIDWVNDSTADLRVRG